ncbi:RabGAP/TBC [Annulohypoxylon truncatum]|uniref:RabGAP/TBC n=1 Tax=Annulohypoxylon truncatum TaxID=327061 RepID=UPI0020072E23|nr:RabGAP/TBC [Annulohypoxylon truncatum]KAI1210670.1 RabGAP/TBC [Annulohypoxylon truncatum]
MSGQEEQQVADAAPQAHGSPAPSDKDTDTFEDAIDTGSIRSLTNRKLSPRPSSIAVSETPEIPEEPQAKKEETNEDIVHENEKEDEKEKETDADDDKKSSIDEEPSPPSKRTSNVSLDNVDLSDGAEAEAEAAEQPPPPPKEEPPIVVQKQPSKKLSLSNIAASLPSMPWSPNPASSESPPKTSPNTAVPPSGVAPTSAPTARKITGPFSWLSRNSTHNNKDKDITSPPVTAATSPRRNTASSIATLTSNPEMMLSKLEEENEGESGPRLSRNSLKDRFKMVRMREEAGISLEDDKPQGLASPTGESSDGNGAAQPPTSPLPPNADSNLAPGTVSGVSAGPSTIADAQVDWDLWQSVVYEGPAAVARTNSEELNRAIATGIPNVIRGVVWQVLAQSKNEELERMYKSLAIRGSEKDKNRDSNSTSISILSNGNLSSEKDAVASSASSVHSEISGGSGKKLPTPPEPSEAALKAQALAMAERKKKEKEDAAALSRLEKTIKRDLGARTSFSKYAAAAGLQDGLFGVCKAYALYDEPVGYAQGMNFLIMPLLFNMPEEEAFCLLVRLMNQYKLRDLFIQDMPGLHMHLYQFERLLEDLEPALYCHLHRRGISPHLYATQWFLTLFAYRFPLQLVLRIYDLIFSEGLSAILKFGIVLMQKNATALLGMSDMGQLTSFLRDKLFDAYIDQSPSAGSILENGFFGSSSSSIDKEVYRADQLIRDACEVKITPELLKSYTVEWEEKTRAEKEREKELEQLKSSNMSYVIKLRKLEERLEASDREQATMTTDLVHTKIENEELKDKNESLTGQVKELHNIIEKQPEEIEQTWKLERDDLMKRNEKVHEENTRLEKEMQELEEELVQTKMRYAEINSQHETLQRKWAELKRQFN